MARAQEILDLGYVEFVIRLLEQADAWKDPETGRPKVKMRRYFFRGSELAADAEDVMPGIAQFRSLELAGRLLGHVTEEPQTAGDVTFVVLMPEPCESAEEWYEKFGRALAERSYALPPGRDVSPEAREPGDQ